MKEWEQGCKCMGRIPTPVSPSGKLLPQREPEKALGTLGDHALAFGAGEKVLTHGTGVALRSQETLSGLGRLLRPDFQAFTAIPAEASAAAQSKCSRVGDNLTGMKT